MKKTILIYSSLTGNTKRLGEAIFEIIEGEKDIYSIEEVNSKMIDKYDRVKLLCTKNNALVRGFLCLGKIADKLVERMGKFPLNLIHPLTPERMIRIENASTHPNEKNFENTKNYFKNIL